MTKYLIRRIFLIIPSLLGITIVTFSLLYIIPSDPALNMVGQQANENTLKEIRKKLALDKPLYYQYWLYLKNLLKGNFGYSYYTNKDVLDSIFERFPKTLLLSFSAILVAVIMGVTLGIFAALYKGSFIDTIIMFFSISFISAPIFWVGLMLILIFSLRINIFPASGYGGFKYLILPAITLGTRSSAYIARITRSSMIDVISQNYILTARAKGFSELMVIFKHALKNSLIPVITLIGVDFASYLNGSVITETIFAWPGFGLLIMEAVLKRDMPVVMGCILFGSMVFIFINLIIDVLYVFFNPKIRY